jgi:hypothetical protein
LWYVLGTTVVLRATIVGHAGHFAIACFKDALVFGVGCGGFLAVAAREAGVDFVVEGAADGFADALGCILVSADDQRFGYQNNLHVDLALRPLGWRRYF